MVLTKWDGDILNTETKTELLRYILLQECRYFDNILCTLLSTTSLMREIERIDERTFSFDIDPKDGMISARNFISNMNRFIRCMKTYFFNVPPLQTCILEIIRNGNQELTNLVSHIPTHLTDDILQELVYKLMILNFISNAKFVPSIQEELATLDIPIKEVKDYNLDESRKIVQFMSDVAFCQRGRGNSLELFDNIEARLNSFDKANDSIRKRKRNLDLHKQRYVESRITDYNKMFKAYNSKKKYLKYFV